MFTRRIRWIEFRPAFVSVCATVVAGLLLMDPIAAVELTPSSSPEPATVPRTSAIYTKMVVAMRRESPPTAISYEETFTPSGLKVTIEAGPHRGPRPTLVFSPNAQQEVFEVTQRDTGAADVVDRRTGQRFSGTSIFWAPTWSSVHAASPLSGNSTAPTSTPSASSAVSPAAFWRRRSQHIRARTRESHRSGPCHQRPILPDRKRRFRSHERYPDVSPAPCRAL